MRILVSFHGIDLCKRFFGPPPSCRQLVPNHGGR
jgi:hypothetical protein